MAATTRVIPVHDVARALGVPGQPDAVLEGLVADGLEIVADWDGSPALAFDDAVAVVAKHRKAEAEWQERLHREANETYEAQACQREFDDVAGRTLPKLRQADPFSVSPAADAQRMAEARRIAYEAVRDRYPAAALARLQRRPIVTIEPGNGPAFKAFETPDTSQMDPEDVAKGIFTPKGKKSFAQRVKDAVSPETV